MYIDHVQAIKIMTSILANDASKESITDRLYELKKKLLKEIADTDAFIVEQDYHESDGLYFEALKFIDKTNGRTLAWFHSPVKPGNKKIMKKIEKLKKKNWNKKLRFKYDNEEESFETKMANKRQRKLEMEEAKARLKEKDLYEKEIITESVEVVYTNLISPVVESAKSSGSGKESILRITEEAHKESETILPVNSIKEQNNVASNHVSEKKVELVMNVEKLLVKDRSLKNEELKDFMKTITMLAQIIKSYWM